MLAFGAVVRGTNETRMPSAAPCNDAAAGVLGATQAHSAWWPAAGGADVARLSLRLSARAMTCNAAPQYALPTPWCSGTIRGLAGLLRRSTLFVCDGRVVARRWRSRCAAPRRCAPNARVHQRAMLSGWYCAGLSSARADNAALAWKQPCATGRAPRSAASRSSSCARAEAAAVKIWPGALSFALAFVRPGCPQATDPRVRSRSL